MAATLTVGALQDPARFGEIEGCAVLLGAVDNAEVLLRETPAGPDATVLFEHETIRMMKAQRVERLEKLRGQIGPASVVLPVRKRPGGFWDHITVGRTPTADIVLDDPAVSNVHAHFELEAEEGRVNLVDLGSANGTHVNREPLQPHTPMPLRTGDCVRFGQTIFYFVGHALVREVLGAESA